MKKQLIFSGFHTKRKWLPAKRKWMPETKPSEEFLDMLTLFALSGFLYCILILAIFTRG